ncbi:uncharacterized protein MEPE_04553 [Melanopsichium pennsylvanicum]|uniref:Uncharacterized protein n=1 Tax=Melanopsichium pennsylvanicum TaxID=63383 RepID=A0AAJ5C6U8_9BASI|nr:uncharacterized protein MEPE_04553 [Melanopsichium pennsylvanicum]
MYRVRGPSVLYDLRASSLGPRTIRLPPSPSAGCFRARPRAPSPLPPGRRLAHVSFRRGVGHRRRRCSPCRRYLRYPASHCHLPNFREIRGDLLSHRISSDSTSRSCANLKSHEPTNIHQISLRSVETCSPTGSQPIQHLWSAQTSSLGPTPVTQATRGSKTRMKNKPKS